MTCIPHHQNVTLKQMLLAFKGNGRWDSDWLIVRYDQNTPITHLGTTLLDHAPGAPTIFSIVKLAKVDLDA